MSGTDAAVMHHTLAVEGGALPVTVARGAATGAAVVVMPSAFGVGPDLEAQLVELTTDARLVVAIDPFFRDDPGIVPFGDMARVMARIRGLDLQRTRRDLQTALDWARAETGGGPVVVVGICFGGIFALLAAADGAVDGVVTWHGSRMETYLSRAAEVRCPLHLHFGSIDPVVPPAAVAAIQAAFADRHDAVITVHEGATHGFSHRSAPAYQAVAEQAGMASVRALVRGVAAG